MNGWSDMKYVLFTILAALLLLVTACGHDADVLVDDAPLANLTVNKTIEDADEPVAMEEDQETLEEQEPEEPEAQPVVTIPGLMELLLDDIDVLKNTYGESEQHELTMILSTAQYDRISSGMLAFNPDCSEEFRLFVSINDHLLYNEIAPCGDLVDVPIAKGDLEAGPNIIGFKNDIEKEYELTDIVLTFTYNDGTTEPLPAEDHFFLPEDTAHKSIKDLGIVSITNKVERVFTLSEEDLLHDLYLGFDALEREGEMIILLNNEAIYEGTLRKEHDIKLPAEYLNTGKNTLLFVGLED